MHEFMATLSKNKVLINANIRRQTEHYIRIDDVRGERRPRSKGQIKGLKNFHKDCYAPTDQDDILLLVAFKCE